MKSLLTAAATAAITTAIPAQPLTLFTSTEPVDVDSGYLHNTADREVAVFTTTVAAPESAWMRLFLRETNLPGTSRLRLTSVQDGAVQYFDAHSLRDYEYGSAYFNGPRVRVELLAGANTRGNRLHIDAREAALDQTGADSICGPTDDRVLFPDARIGRGMNGASACTWWLFEAPFAIATAGHCISSSSSSDPWIVGFNIPLSTSTGQMVHPPPDDQYAVDQSTAQWQSSGQGADWAVMALVRNSNHGQYPGERQGAWFQLGPVPFQSGTTIRITGNGRVSAPVSPTWNSVTKTHTGPLSSTTSTRIRYRTDTTGGNSGSPIINEATGLAVGIHTHGGCSSGSGSNSGTRIDRSNLAAAITQVLNSVTVGTLSTFGKPCAGSAGVPALALTGIPDIGNTIDVGLSGLAPFQPAVLGIGTSVKTWLGSPLPLNLAPFGFGNCTLYTSLDLVLPLSTGGGSTNLQFPLPPDPAVIGLRLYCQAAAADPGARRSSGAVFTNAGQVFIGG